MIILIQSLITLSSKDFILGGEALAHAEKMIKAMQGDYPAEQRNRDFSIGIEILQRYIDRTGEILENAAENCDYSPITI